MGFRLPQKRRGLKLNTTLGRVIFRFRLPQKRRGLKLSGECSILTLEI